VAAPTDSASLVRSDQITGCILRSPVAKRCHGGVMNGWR
jgi:hypothetical protein